MEISPQQTCDDLFSLLSRVKAAMYKISEPHNLTPVQVAALHTISDGHITMGDVATTMNCDASNVTGIIDRLVAQKLVIRRESTADRRTKNLVLTTEGQQIMARIIAELPGALGCQKLNAVERLTLHQVIAKLVA